MKNRNSIVGFDRLVWMYAPSGTWQTVPARSSNRDRKRRSEVCRSRLMNRAQNDVASGIAYLVLAGSLVAALIEFFAALPSIS
jgi:hypothetical protein